MIYRKTLHLLTCLATLFSSFAYAPPVSEEDVTTFTPSQTVVLPFHELTPLIQPLLDSQKRLAALLRSRKKRAEWNHDELDLISQETEALLRDVHKQKFALYSTYMTPCPELAGQAKHLPELGENIIFRYKSRDLSETFTFQSSADLSRHLQEHFSTDAHLFWVFAQWHLFSIHLQTYLLQQTGFELDTSVFSDKNEGAANLDRSVTQITRQHAETQVVWAQNRMKDFFELGFGKSPESSQFLTSVQFLQLFHLGLAPQDPPTFWKWRRDFKTKRPDTYNNRDQRYLLHWSRMQSLKLQMFEHMLDTLLDFRELGAHLTPSKEIAPPRPLDMSYVVNNRKQEETLRALQTLCLERVAEFKGAFSDLDFIKALIGRNKQRNNDTVGPWEEAERGFLLKIIRKYLALIHDLKASSSRHFPEGFAYPHVAGYDAEEQTLDDATPISLKSFKRVLGATNGEKVGPNEIVRKQVPLSELDATLQVVGGERGFPLEHVYGFRLALGYIFKLAFDEALTHLQLSAEPHTHLPAGPANYKLRYIHSLHSAFLDEKGQAFWKLHESITGLGQYDPTSFGVATEDFVEDTMSVFVDYPEDHFRTVFRVLCGVLEPTNRTIPQESLEALYRWHVMRTTLFQFWNQSVALNWAAVAKKLGVKKYKFKDPEQPIRIFPVTLDPAKAGFARQLRTDFQTLRDIAAERNVRTRRKGKWVYSYRFERRDYTTCAEMLLRYTRAQLGIEKGLDVLSLPENKRHFQRSKKPNPDPLELVIKFPHNSPLWRQRIPANEEDVATFLETKFSRQMLGTLMVMMADHASQVWDLEVLAPHARQVAFVDLKTPADATNAQSFSVIRNIRAERIKLCTEMAERRKVWMAAFDIFHDTDLPRVVAPDQVDKLSLFRLARRYPEESFGANYHQTVKPTMRRLEELKAELEQVQFVYARSGKEDPAQILRDKIQQGEARFNEVADTVPSTYLAQAAWWQMHKLRRIKILLQATDQVDIQPLKAALTHPKAPERKKESSAPKKKRVPKEKGHKAARKATSPTAAADAPAPAEKRTGPEAPKPVEATWPKLQRTSWADEEEDDSIDFGLIPPRHLDPALSPPSQWEDPKKRHFAKKWASEFWVFHPDHGKTPVLFSHNIFFTDDTEFPALDNLLCYPSNRVQFEEWYETQQEQ